MGKSSVSNFSPGLIETNKKFYQRYGSKGTRDFQPRFLCSSNTNLSSILHMCTVQDICTLYLYLIFVDFSFSVSC
jgi:hypothetical protein